LLFSTYLFHFIGLKEQRKLFSWKAYSIPGRAAGPRDKSALSVRWHAIRSHELLSGISCNCPFEAIQPFQVEKGRQAQLPQSSCGIHITSWHTFSLPLKHSPIRQKHTSTLHISTTSHVCINNFTHNQKWINLHHKEIM